MTQVAAGGAAPAADSEGGVDPEQEALVADSVGVAMLMVLDTWRPGQIAFVLHDLFAVPFDEIAQVVDRSSDRPWALGAVVCGRRTYDDSVPCWGADGPSGPMRVPTFVVTHQVPESSPADGVYEFVTGGSQDALARAKASAASNTVCIMGGADLGRQYLAAGLVDEISCTSCRCCRIRHEPPSRSPR